MIGPIGLLLLFILGVGPSVSPPSGEGLHERSNLVARCIVPFDAAVERLADRSSP